MLLELNSGQSELSDKICTWYRKPVRSKPYYSYSGAAGTGKTTIVKVVKEYLNLKDDEIICAAYIGKAVLQLQKHGLRACTIHSLIYHAVEVSEPPDPDDPRQRRKTKFIFIKREKLDPAIKLIIIDEATMVNDKLRDELLSFGIPIIFIGDMNQLPPIFGVSSVMMRPDFILTQIMRQAENDPIVQLSQRVLNDQPLYCGNYGNSKIVDQFEVNQSIIDDYDIIICAKNATRETINTTIRRDVLGFLRPEPELHDKMICRQNNWDIAINGIALTNGLIGSVKDISRSMAYKGYFTIAFQPDFMSEAFEDVRLDLNYLRSDVKDRNSYGISKFNKFEYGYAITAHLSQGSEYGRVLFIDEHFWDGELSKKLRYTAITRAREAITIVSAYPRYRPPYYNF